MPVITLAGILFGLTMVMVSIALVMAVIVTNIYLRKDTKQRVPALLCWIFLRRFEDVARIGRKSTEVNPERDCLRSAEADLDGLSVLSGLGECQWKDSKVYGVRRNNHSAPVCDLWSLGTKCRKCRCIPREPGADWMSLAKAVDGLFFWIFVASSVACLLGMFATIPQQHS